MGFTVYQGEVKDTNKLTIAPSSQKVGVSGTGDKTSVTLNPADGQGAGKTATQPADGATIFINEGGATGRQVVVAWDGTTATPGAATPRSKPATVAPPPPGQWMVTQDGGNIRDSKLDGDFLATTPKGWQSGPSVTFTTSMCGLDNFIVTYRYAQAGKDQLAHVVVTVRKRIQCHLFEMKKSSGATDTIDDFRAALTYAQGVFEKYGIDLVFPGDKVAPEGTLNYANSLTQTQLHALIPASKAPGRKPTDLWIGVVHAINGHEDGLGGQSQVFVEVKKNADAKKAYDSWVSDWQSASRSKTVEEWSKKYPRDEQKLARQLANEVVTPDSISLLNRQRLLVHEIGHALGLVPTDGKAGGSDQSSWEDSTHTGHCSEKSCVMYWESGFASLGFEGEMNKASPFSHVPNYGLFDKNDEKDCMLYLRAADLSDLRNLPK